MQVRTRQDQEEPLKVLAARRNSSVPVEAQEAIDAHLLAHREVLKREPKLVKKGAR